MNAPMTAEDILPLIEGLPAEERERLFRLLLHREVKSDAAAYAACPVQPDEFSSEGDSLSWEAEGWEAPH